MQKPNGYDTTTPQSGMIEYPEAGPIKCIIIAAKTEISSNGNEMLVLDLDIHEGKFAGFYARKFNNDERENKRWQLKHYRLTNEENVGRLKGDIKAIEESNPGFIFDFNESSLVNKVVGCNLREEEYLNSKGEIKSSLKPVYLFPLKDILKQKHLSKKEVKEKTDSEIIENVVSNNNLPF
jgi:hypothetical protein